MSEPPTSHPPQFSTTTPPSPPLGPDNRPESPGRGRRRLIVAWILIAVLGVAFAWGDSIVAAIVPATATPDPVEQPDIALELSAKVYVGSKSVLDSLGASGGDREQLDSQFRKEVDKAALSLEEIDALPAKQRDAERARALRSIMMGAEFIGAEESIERIDSLAADGSESLKEDAQLVTQILADGAESISESQREQLIEHHGWIGRLTTTFDLSHTDARRAEILSEARNAFLAIVGAGFLAVLAIVAGLFLFVLAIVLKSQKKLRFAYQPDRRSPLRINAAYLEVMAMFLGGFVLITAVAALVDHSRLRPETKEAVGLAIFGAEWLLLAAALWPLARGERFAGLRRGLGWHTGRGVFREIGAGFLGYFAGLPIVVMGFLITVVLIVTLDFNPTHPIQENARDAGPLGVLLLFSLAVVWAPLVEETMFRGAFYHSMRRWTGPILSGIVVAFVFAAIHPQGISTIPVLMSLAIVFAMIREWRGSIIGPMIAHALHNGVIVTLNIVMMG